MYVVELPDICGWYQVPLQFWYASPLTIVVAQPAGGWFTMGQLLSLPMLLGGLALMLIAYQRRIPSGNFLPAP